MIVSMLVLLFSASPNAFGEPAMTVWAAGYYEHLRAVLPKNDVEFMDQRTVAADERLEGYLPPDRRDALLKRLKLDGPLAKFDDLDKDMLVMGIRDANEGELAKMRRKYNTLTPTQLRRLRTEVGKLK